MKNIPMPVAVAVIVVAVVVLFLVAQKAMAPKLPEYNGPPHSAYDSYRNLGQPAPPGR
jgi:hypothetical protein